MARSTLYSESMNRTGDDRSKKEPNYLMQKPEPQSLSSFTIGMPVSVPVLAPSKLRQPFEG